MLINSPIDFLSLFPICFDGNPISKTSHQGSYMSMCNNKQTLPNLDRLVFPNTATHRLYCSRTTAKYKSNEGLWASLFTNKRYSGSPKPKPNWQVTSKMPGLPTHWSGLESTTKLQIIWAWHISFQNICNCSFFFFKSFIYSIWSFHEKDMFLILLRHHYETNDKHVKFVQMGLCKY